MANFIRTGAGRTKHFESVVYATMWLLVLVLPFVNELMRVSLDYDFSWSNILRWTVGTVTFMLVFALHNYFLVPRYLLAGRLKLYVVAVALTMALFVTFQYETYDMRMEMFRPKMEMIGDPPPPPSPPKARMKFFGLPMPVLLNVTLLMLMFGINISVVFVFRYQKEREKREALENSRLQDEIRFLKAQINPHFFMNVMNNIHSMIELDPAKAQDMTLELSGLMRYMLYEGDNNTVPLSKEVAFISNYITMLKRRFHADKVEVTFEPPHSFAKDCMVPPLLFIAFVENAFKHGVSYQNLSVINIKIEEIDGEVYFHCRNSIPKSSPVPKVAGGIGLENAKRRLELLYGDGYHLDITTENGFYNVNLIIPGL